MTYPYRDAFINWCQLSENLKEVSVIRTDISLSEFWDYLFSTRTVDYKPSDVIEADIRSYLVWCQDTAHKRPRTINLILSNIKKYFTYLYNHKFIVQFPVVNLHGVEYDRTPFVVTDWMQYLDDFKESGLSDNTLKLLVYISLGMYSKNLGKVTVGEVARQDKNNVIADTFGDLGLESSAPFFQTKTDKAYVSTNSFCKHLREANKDAVLPKYFSLNPSHLRRSYLLTKVANTDKNDLELMQELGIEYKSLVYYKTCLATYKIVDYRTIREDFLNKIEEKQNQVNNHMPFH